MILAFVLVARQRGAAVDYFMAGRRSQRRQNPRSRDFRSMPLPAAGSNQQRPLLRKRARDAMFGLKAPLRRDPLTRAKDRNRGCPLAPATLWAAVSWGRPIRNHRH